MKSIKLNLIRNQQQHVVTIPWCGIRGAWIMPGGHEQKDSRKAVQIFMKTARKCGYCKPSEMMI